MAALAEHWDELNTADWFAQLQGAEPQPRTGATQARSPQPDKPDPPRHRRRQGGPMSALTTIAAITGILAAGIIYGTDAFCALVQRPALTNARRRHADRGHGPNTPVRRPAPPRPRRHRHPRRGGHHHGRDPQRISTRRHCRRRRPRLHARMALPLPPRRRPDQPGPHHRRHPRIRRPTTPASSSRNGTASSPPEPCSWASPSPASPSAPPPHDQAARAVVSLIHRSCHQRRDNQPSRSSATPVSSNPSSDV